jgi:hypothetical protein
VIVTVTDKALLLLLVTVMAEVAMPLASTGVVAVVAQLVHWARTGAANRARTASPTHSSARRPRSDPGKNLTATPRHAIVVYYLQA